MIRTTVVALAAVLLGPAALAAQTGAGIGLRVAEPRGAFADRVAERGYGVVGTSVVTGQSVWLSMSSAWTRFPAPDPVDGQDAATDADGNVLEDQDVYELMLGWGIRVGPLRAGIRGGRFFGDGAEWGYMPVAGLGLGQLLLEAEWDLRGDVRWVGVSGSWVY